MLVESFQEMRSEFYSQANNCDLYCVIDYMCWVIIKKNKKKKFKSPVKISKAALLISSGANEA